MSIKYVTNGPFSFKLLLTFTAGGQVMARMRQFLRESYTWEYTGEHENQANEEDEAEFNF